MRGAQVKRRERGFALLMGLTVLVVLTILGLSVMSSVGEDLSVVRTMRESENALAIAEAGIAWGLNQLNVMHGLEENKQYNPILRNDTTVDGSNFYDIPDANDEICQGLSPGQCDNWWEITDTDDLPEFGETDDNVALRGRFRVVVGDDNDGDDDYTADQNKMILLRALGIDARGAKRLIEVAVTAGGA